MADKPIALQLTEAQATIATLTAEKATLITERDTARTEKDSAVSAATGPLTTQVTALSKQRDDEMAAHTITKASLATAQTEITTLKASAKTAGQSAVEIAAAQATKPVGAEAPKEKGAEGDENAFTKYQSLMATNPAEASAFYEKNKAQIIKDGRSTK